jgi:hypothetical protein
MQHDSKAYSICEALEKSESNLQDSKYSLDVLSNGLHWFAEFHADTSRITNFHRVDKTRSSVIATVANEIQALKDFATTDGVVCHLPILWAKPPISK